MGSRFFNAVLLVCFVGSIALAQPERAVIGTVLDETGAVLPGVTVELITDAGAEATLTDDGGSYRFDGVGQSRATVLFR
ncbi:uncharacterized protein METZ01_LOCUS437765, partial [marine metagenome]